MKIIIVTMVIGSVASATAIQAATYVKQPLDTLSYVYGHTQEISDSVADGSFKGINVKQKDIRKDISELDNEGRSNIQSLQSIYADLEKLEQ